MMLSLAVVTVLMGGITAFVTTPTTADTSTTGGYQRGFGATPAPTEGPVCNAPGSPSSSSAAPAGSPAAQQETAAQAQTKPPTSPPPTDVPCPTSGVLYSHSWYVTDANSVANLGTGDAQWLSEQTAHTSCPREFLTVLDFGHPTLKFGGHAAPLDAYAMTLFGFKDTWRTYHEIEQLAEQYLDNWITAASPCPNLILVLGANNYGECQYAAGACNVTTAGQYWDVAAHDVMDYVSSKGYGSRVTGVWVGDDLETSWDPWATTERFLRGVQTQEQTYATHAQLVDYGDAHPGVCSLVTNSCHSTWTAQNIYDAAWNIGWDLPVPELYSPITAGRWESIANAFPTMQYRGVMTECGGHDPLPLGGCLTSNGGTGPGSNAGSCEWSPAIAFSYAVRYAQSASGHQPPAYATNIQWLPTIGGSSGGTPTVGASGSGDSVDSSCT